ncbi:variable large family protein (plasmid) [Borreliella finlandensis]|uniref:variable large family protein n=1 Tax=Borreliella finlandensis TaxID=498741 RepID=UPI003AEF7D3E
MGRRGKADASSVTGIAKGIKGIVDAAGKAIGGKPGGVLAGVTAAADNNNEEAGKLFAGSNGAGAAVDAAAVGKAAAAVSAVSGEQILKAIVDAAGAAEKAKEAKEGQAPGDAKNPIEAAIGTDNGNGADFDDGEMKKSDKIAAAIVLRGLAKDGKFAAVAANSGKENVKSAVESAVGKVSGWLEEMIKAAGEAAAGSTGGSGEKIGDTNDDKKGKEADASSVTGIAKGIKGIVDAAGKAITGKPGGDVLADVTAADDNEEAGKLFAGSKGKAVDADAEAIGKAAAAVSAVSGEQILKAIVDAAEKAKEAKGQGKAPNAATNPIEAAIGTDNNGADFGNDMKKSDKIAAAGSTGGGEKIGDTGGDGQKGEKADASSVTGIAKGIKGIVDAAGKAITGKPGGVLADVKAAAKDNEEAGKLFAGSAGAGNVDAAAIGKAAAAVSAVSGEHDTKSDC